MSSAVEQIKQQKREIIDRYAKPDNIAAAGQIVLTLVPLAALWWVVPLSAGISLWLTAGVTVLMSLFLLRAFVLMHDCGHGSQFGAAWLNRSCGFVLGVVTGMPQFVWSRHHAYHHSTNGNWAKYRGPLNTRSVDEFSGLSDSQQRRYQAARSIWLAPFAGFVYQLYMPRTTWLIGSISLVAHILKRKIAQPGVSLRAHAREYKTRRWGDADEYWHMFWNNAMLLNAWALMVWWIGPVLFFSVYVISVSLAGMGGIVLFAVQHNFKHSYATGDDDWDYDTAAVLGTSFLILPRWLGWFTADIAYHHVHHLSARIPNYRLADCHHAYASLFADVPRIRLSDIPASLKYILWDTRGRRIVSVAEYRQGLG